MGCPFHFGIGAEAVAVQEGATCRNEDRSGGAMKGKPMGAGMGWFVAAVVGALVLAQGGFYAGSVLVAGAVSAGAVAATLVMRRHSSGTSRVKKTARVQLREEHHVAWRPGYLVAAFLLVSCLSFASSLVHGLGEEGLGNAGCWLSLAVFAYLCQGITGSQCAVALDGLGWFIALTGGVGALAAVGVLPPEGTMAAGRLCILFEYSNATGIWFGMGAMVLLASSDKRLNALVPVPLFALLLSESVGSLVVTALALGVAGAFFSHQKDYWRLACLASGWLGATGGFGAYLAAPGAGIAAVVGAVAALLWVRFGQKEREEKPTLFVAARILALAAVTVTVAAVAAIVAVEPARWTQAQGTFAERIIQMRDGLALLASDPLLGVGPGRWAELYPAVQTAEYTAAVNHCSYLQIALDAGFLAPVVLVTALGLSAFRCGKEGEPLWAVAVVMLLAHSVFDFDLSFFSLLFMAVLLVGGCNSRSRKVRS